MFEKFNAQARQAVVHAQEEAQRLNQHYIGTEHLLLGLLDVDGSVAAEALTALSISTDDVRRDVEEITGRGEEPPTAHIPFTPRSKQVLDLSVLEAMQLNHSSVGTAHILLGLLRERDGVAGRVLTARGIGLDQLRQHVTLLAGDPRTPHSQVTPSHVTARKPSPPGKPNRPRTRSKSAGSAPRTSACAPFACSMAPLITQGARPGSALVRRERRQPPTWPVRAGAPGGDRAR